MSHVYNKNLTARSQQLRTDMTPQEKKLWYHFLKLLPITVKRQRPIHNFILDFFIESKKLAIEIDGRQHFSEEHRIADEKRDAELNGLGIRVLRYRNSSIDQDFQWVCTDIMKHIEER